jgi:alanyl-tRNA synthetase
MTEQLYYQDSYIKDFEAVVLSCIPNGNHFEAVLDRTAFFPEGGGQCADTGVLHIENRKIKVFDVQERNGEIIHFIDEEILPGQTVIGELEFQERFSKMQQHTGEHIISGIVHRRFGYENVGFHLGKEEVTMDYDGPLTGEELRSVEYEANQVVAENREIKAYFPSTEELEKIPYRSKKELQGKIRIVEIQDCDICACCAPHVQTTGNVGLIKITNAIRYKGGMRLWIACGMRALEDYNQKEASVVQISNMLSAKQQEVTEAVKRLTEEIQQLKEKAAKMQEKLVMGYLESETEALKENPNANLLLFEKELDAVAMRNFVNAGMELTKGVCGVFIGDEKQGFRYVLGSSGDIREIGKKLNEAFQGKGGGKPPMIQGSLVGEEKKIREFLDEI